MTKEPVDTAMDGGRNGDDAAGGGDDSGPEAVRIQCALDRVRRDLAGLAADPSPAPDVPADVAARIGAALRAAPAAIPAPAAENRVTGPRRREQSVHSSRRSLPRMPRLQIVGLVAGSVAAALAVGLGTVSLFRTPPSTLVTDPTAEQITVSRPAADARIPLSDPQIVSLLARAPDYGPLTDPRRRASCLSGLGYPTSTRVLGAQPLDMDGHPGVLIVLPGDTPGVLTALVVAPNCSSADTGLLADTVLARP